MRIPEARRADDHLHAQPGRNNLAIQAWWTNAKYGYLIFWGDATQDNAGPNNAVLDHTYTRPGAYLIQAKELNGVLMGDLQVVVRPTWDLPITHGPSPDNPDLYEVRFGEVDETWIVPRIRVNWRDGSPVEETWGVPGESLTHYLQPGTHIVSVYDLMSNNYRHFRDIVIDHVNDPEFTLTADGHTVTLTVENATAGKDLVVAWGDASGTEPVSGTTATHTYPSTVDDTWLVQLWYANASSFTTKSVATPGGSS